VRNGKCIAVDMHGEGVWYGFSSDSQSYFKLILPNMYDERASLDKLFLALLTVLGKIG